MHFTHFQLYYTVDFGESFTMLQSGVKSFSWSSSVDANMPVHLYVERKEPTSNYLLNLFVIRNEIHSIRCVSDSSTVIFMNAAQLLKDEPKKFNMLIENVQDFHIKKDFMFAIRKVLNHTQLWISYQRGPFVQADFQTELEIKVSMNWSMYSMVPCLTFISFKGYSHRRCGRKAHHGVGHSLGNVVSSVCIRNWRSNEENPLRAEFGVDFLLCSRFELETQLVGVSFNSLFDFMIRLFGINFTNKSLLIVNSMQANIWWSLHRLVQSRRNARHLHCVANNTSITWI